MAARYAALRTHLAAHRDAALDFGIRRLVEVNAAGRIRGVVLNQAGGLNPSADGIYMVRIVQHVGPTWSLV